MNKAAKKIDLMRKEEREASQKRMEKISNATKNAGELDLKQKEEQEASQKRLEKLNKAAEKLDLMRKNALSKAAKEREASQKWMQKYENERKQK